MQFLWKAPLQPLVFRWRILFGQSGLCKNCLPFGVSRIPRVPWVVVVEEKLQLFMDTEVEERRGERCLRESLPVSWSLVS